MSDSVTTNPTLGTSIPGNKVSGLKTATIIGIVIGAIIICLLIGLVVYYATKSAECVHCNCTTPTLYNKDQAGRINASPSVVYLKPTSDYWRTIRSPFDNEQPSPVIFNIPANAIPVSSDNTLFKTSDIIIKESSGIVITPVQNDFVQLSIGNSDNKDMTTDNFDINYDIPVIIITPNKTQITYHTIFDVVNKKSVNHFIIPAGSAFVLVSPNDKAPTSSTDVYNPMPYISKVYNTPIYFKVNSSATIQSIPLPPVEAPLSYNPIVTTLDMTLLTPVQVSDLDPLIIQGLNLMQITQLSNLHISALTNTQISYLTPTQLNSFSQAQIQGLTASQIASLTLSQISILNTNFVATIPASKFINLSIPQMIAFSNIITSSGTGCVTPAQLNTMNTSLLNFISLLNASNTTATTTVVPAVTAPVAPVAPTATTTVVPAVTAPVAPTATTTVVPAVTAPVAITTAQVAPVAAPTSSVLDITPTPITPPATTIAATTTTTATTTATSTTATAPTTTAAPVQSNDTQSITKLVASFGNIDNYSTSNFLSRSSRYYI